MAGTDTALLQKVEPPIPGGFTKMLRNLARDFKGNIRPELRKRSRFISKSSERRTARAKSVRNSNILRISFTPFAETLGSLETQETRQWSERRIKASVQIHAKTLVSVFVLAFFPESETYHFQKVAKKFAPGLPGGSIEKNELTFDTAKREYAEETSDGQGSNGIDISKYPLNAVGEFELTSSPTIKREVDGMGALVLVELPESEKANIKSGGGICEEGENITGNYFWTFDEVQKMADENRIMRNSIKAWLLYLDYLLK